MAVNLGDKIRFIPTGWEGKRDFAHGPVIPEAVTGRVIYIHPRGRFCTVEARVGDYSFREALFLDRTGR